MAHADAESREMDVAGSVDELVGETPLLHLDSIAENVYGKVEAANPLLRQGPYRASDRRQRRGIGQAHTPRGRSSQYSRTAERYLSTDLFPEPDLED